MHNLATDTPPQQAKIIDLTVPQVRVDATARMPIYCGTLYIEVFARAGKFWGFRGTDVLRSTTMYLWGEQPTTR